MSTIPHSLPTGRAAFLPFAAPDIGEAEIAAVTRVLRSGWITTGPETKAFEREFAEAVGVAHAVALNSCTAALHLGLEALGVRPGDEVLTTTLTFTATAEVVEYLGARTRLLDIAPDTLNLDPEQVRAFVLRDYVRANGEWRHRDGGGRLRAIVPVHFAGLMCDMGAFVALGQELGVAILDDAAHAFPAFLNGRGVGGFGCPTAFSFYATKTITTGEGGMLTTDDERIAERVRLMALHGISRDAWNRYAATGTWQYEVVEPGYKYNLTDIAAALGRVQLKRATEMLARREAIAERYQTGFRGLEGLVPPAAAPAGRHAWHLFAVRLNHAALSIDRARFIEELRGRRVGASVHFIPLHMQPFYRKRYNYHSESFPVAEEVFPRLVSLPIYSSMTSAQVDLVIEAVRDVCTTFGT